MTGATGDATQPDPASLAAVCPRCGEELWRERAGQWSLVAAIVKLGADGQLIARCSRDRCKGEASIPWLAIQAPPTPTPIPTDTRRPRLGVRRRLVVSP